jgi:hypothetical protein
VKRSKLQRSGQLFWSSWMRLISSFPIRLGVGWLLESLESPTLLKTSKRIVFIILVEYVPLSRLVFNALSSRHREQNSSAQCTFLKSFILILF